MVECQQCGRCCRVCLDAGSRSSHWVFEITDEDLARWERENRDDILARVSIANNSEGERARATFIATRHAEQCPFLQEQGAHYVCLNHETKPAVCAAFHCVDQRWSYGAAYQLAVEEGIILETQDGE